MTWITLNLVIWSTVALIGGSLFFFSKLLFVANPVAVLVVNWIAVIMTIRAAIEFGKARAARLQATTEVDGSGIWRTFQFLSALVGIAGFVLQVSGLRV